MTARYKSRMYDTEDEARTAFDLLEWAGVHARVVGPIRTEVIMTLNTPDDCGFCHGQPVGNAARWTSAGQPEYAPCPRCGRTFETVEEWEVNIVLSPELPDTTSAAKAKAWVPAPPPDEWEHDRGRSTIWDELEETRD